MKTAPSNNLGSNLYSRRYQLGLIVVVGLAIYFRFYHLGSLPPGLSSGEANTASTAMSIIHKATTFTELLKPGTGHALYTFVTALSIKLLGPTSFALRLPAAILGLAAVFMTYAWIKSWFGEKVGLIAAFLVAVTPWTVGLSRISVPSSGNILIVPLTLWLLTKAARSKSLIWSIIAGASLALGTASLMGLFLLAGLTIVILPFKILRNNKENPKLRRYAIITIIATTVLGAPLIFLRLKSATFNLPTINISFVEAAASRTSLTLGMFNIRGDGDFQYNIAGTPELNLFIGLMFIVGVISCFIRFKQARYRTLLILLTSLLIPVSLAATAPNSLKALIAAPIVLSLAAIGTNYMLDVWYSTFPINSAARTLGTVPIVLLLVISAYQGYKQYFVAWAHSPETYTAYNERAASLAGYLNRTNFNGNRYVIVSNEDLNVINFLASHKGTFTTVPATQIINLPQTSSPQQIIFTTPQPSDILPDLKKRFPKAQLSQHFSEFNDNNQLFAVYQTKP